MDRARFLDGDGLITMQTQRPHRIAELIQQELASLLEFRTNDPRFKQVTVTFVNVSPDLRHAKIYVLMHDEKELNKVLVALNKAHGYFRSEIAHNLNLRFTPKLTFVYDESISRGSYLSNLIDKI